MRDLLEECITAVHEHLDDLIHEWHESNTMMPLHNYIGFTYEEYKGFIEDPDFFEKWLKNKLREGRSLER